MNSNQAYLDREAPVKGLIAPVFTPLDGQGNLNLGIIPLYADYLVNGEIDGILIGGTTGEFATLCVGDRKKLITEWTSLLKGRGMKIIVQVGGAPMPDVLELAKFANESEEVTAVMTLPELYFKPRTTEQLISYLEAVAKAAHTKPLVYYHFPMMSGVNINAKEFFTQASKRINNFVGMKADIGVALEVADLIQPYQRIFNGNHILAPSVLMGQDSSIATVTNIFPDLVKAIVASTKSGDLARAKFLQIEMNRIVDAVNACGDFLPAMKATMAMVTGLQIGPPNRPLRQISEEQLTNLRDNLIKLNVKLA